MLYHLRYPRHSWHLNISRRFARFFSFWFQKKKKGSAAIRETREVMGAVASKASQVWTRALLFFGSGWPKKRVIHSYNVRPPRYKLVYNSNNYSYKYHTPYWHWSYLHQLSYRLGASHCNIKHFNLTILWGRIQSKSSWYVFSQPQITIRSRGKSRTGFWGTSFRQTEIGWCDWMVPFHPLNYIRSWVPRPPGFRGPGSRVLPGAL